MIEVLSSPRVGNTLFIDGDLQLSAFDEFIYHEALAHIPLAYVAQRPASVLVIGGGDGGVCARVLQHEWVASLTLVDIDEAPLTAWQSRAEQSRAEQIYAASHDQKAPI